MTKRVGKRGDTLIEVMLAVGIFSMVAVAVVAVMSGGTSSAQTALETTLTREEIDAQAEALRFIQASYIAEKKDVDGKFGQLWNKIAESSITNEGEIDAIAQYSPEDCSTLYSASGEAKNYGFVINTRKLGTFSSPSEVISKNLSAAQTYPRLIFNGDGGSLVDSGTDNLQKAEGIYIIAVKEPKNSTSTSIVGTGNTSAYYDFYIRTCWYGTGDQTPSTISTVMRLYDPKFTKD